MELKNKRITVMGIGSHGGGVGNIKWLHQQGAILTVTDLRLEGELRESLEEIGLLPDINWVLGEHREDDFTNADMVLRNPAVPKNSPYLEIARKSHVPVEMDSSLFLKLSPTDNIFGVTGSKGKSTTVHVLASLMSLKYAKVAAIGIEGSSPLAALTGLTARDLVVFELSSWRLEGLAEWELSPATAIVTSLYRDHLNTYDSFDEYVETKKAIVRHQTIDDLAMLNFDDGLIRRWPADIPSRIAWYSLGMNIPGDGIGIHRGMVTIFQNRGNIPLFPVEAIPFSSDHEIRNALPAIYFSFCSGVRVSSIRLRLENIKTLAHRMETVRVINNVTYINDSAATIPDATIAAIKSLSERHLVLILGGSDKRLNFDNLCEVIREARIRGLVFLPGSATDRMLKEVASAWRHPPEIHEAGSMAEAVKTAVKIVKSDDVVLMSPAAASFGLFKNEFDRGRQFKEAVMELLA
ncbi:MAG: UDP-N-acetylmuramoyl-L-alanine--D-glutamate ligase [bacterium]|nr:UDP-N-acetylmuramoyl-L-alanine--D-glutamate ligase [bacterium]